MIHGGRCPSRRRSAAADSAAGTFEIATAARKGRPIAPPAIRVDPRTTDSGIPSSIAPSTIAGPLSAALAMRFPRRAPPRRPSIWSPVKKVRAPAARLAATGSVPPCSNASWVRSKARALTRAPAPKAIASGTRPVSPINAPSTSADAAASPHRPASSIAQSSPNGLGREGLGGRRKRSSSLGPLGSGSGHSSPSSGGRVCDRRSPQPTSAEAPSSSRR